MRAVFLGRVDAINTHPALSCLTLVWQSRVRLHSYAQSPFVGQRFNFKCGATEDAGALIQIVRQRPLAGRGKLRGPELLPLSPECSDPKVVMSLRGKCAIVPTTVPEPRLRDLFKGEKHHKTEHSEPHLKGNYFTGNRAWSSLSLWHYQNQCRLWWRQLWGDW